MQAQKITKEVIEKLDNGYYAIFNHQKSLIAVVEINYNYNDPRDKEIFLYDGEKLNYRDLEKRLTSWSGLMKGFPLDCGYIVIASEVKLNER